MLVFVEKREDIVGHVFISYVRENIRAVNRLQRALESAGIPVWRDTANLWPGEDWRAKIRNAIVSDALVFIACFSSESNTRKVSYQYAELNLAIEQLKLRRPDEPWLIPIRFDKTCYVPDFDIGGGRTLRSLHHTDLFGRRLPENTKRLVQTVLRMLGQDSTEPSSVAVPDQPLNSPTESKVSVSSQPSVISGISRSAESIANAGEQPSEGALQKGRAGSIVTFYSYKGGTGRTMAIANVAWILAANGNRVLMADWDLDSPGLHRFFGPFFDHEINQRTGIVDFVRRYAWEAADSELDPYAFEVGSDESKKAARDAVAGLINGNIDDTRYCAIPLSWHFPGNGALHFMSSGKQTNGDYYETLMTLDWDNFYENLYGGQFFDALREYMKHDYDYVLVDSRTGLGDVADICTLHLPDVVVDCFTLSTQGIEGSAAIASAIQSRSDRNIKIWPVPMRIENRQADRVAAGLEFAAGRFAGLPSGMSEKRRQEYWRTIGVPYHEYYAYEERLAVFGDATGSQSSLLSAYEHIAACITGGAVTTLPPMPEKLRKRAEAMFRRS